jgi:hypothetical protein
MSEGPGKLGNVPALEGYLSLFVGAFLAATGLPFLSEIMVGGLLFRFCGQSGKPDAEKMKQLMEKCGC